MTKEELDTRIEIARGFLAVSSALRMIAIHADVHNKDDVAKALDAVSDHVNKMVIRIGEDMKS